MFVYSCLSTCGVLDKRASWITASLGWTAAGGGAEAGSGSMGTGEPSRDRLSGVCTPLEWAERTPEWLGDAGALLSSETNTSRWILHTLPLKSFRSVRYFQNNLILVISKDALNWSYGTVKTNNLYFKLMLLFWTFYSSKNPEKTKCFRLPTKIRSGGDCFHHCQEDLCMLKGECYDPDLEERGPSGVLKHGTPRGRRFLNACSTSLLSDDGSILQNEPLPGSSCERGTLMKYRFSDRLWRIEFWKENSFIMSNYILRWCIDSDRHSKPNYFSNFIMFITN